MIAAEYPNSYLDCHLPGEGGVLQVKSRDGNLKVDVEASAKMDAKAEAEERKKKRASKQRKASQVISLFFHTKDFLFVWLLTILKVSC